MLPFDLVYAQKFKEMCILYGHVNEHTLSAPTILELHTSITTDISNYYKYLEKTGTPVEDSYLTHWLDKNDYMDWDERVYRKITESTC